VVLLVGAMLASATPTSYEPPALVANPVGHVDTLIGTGQGGRAVGEINNFPGATVPFGMVQYSPDTVDTYAGYDYGKDQVTGFSMTHASVGCAAFGDISMLPTTSPIGSQPWDASERIAHDDYEVGVPGYYTVRFPATGVTAELSATTRTGVGRFRYPHNRQPARFYVRSGGSLGGNSAATIQIGQDNTTITGSATSGGFCGKDNVYTVYFAMKFSKPFTSFGTWDGFSVSAGDRSAYSSYSGSSGGYVEFPAGSVLEVRTALSYVGVDGARANLAEGAASFDDVRAVAHRDSRRRWRRCGDLLHRPLPCAVAPQHFQRRRRTLHRIRRRHPHRGGGTYPVRQFLRLGHLPGSGGAARAALPAAGQRHGPVAGQ
jgi:putative alpha-1,2-mannosidase